MGRAVSNDPLDTEGCRGLLRLGHARGCAQVSVPTLQRGLDRVEFGHTRHCRLGLASKGTAEKASWESQALLGKSKPHENMFASISMTLEVIVLFNN